MFTGVRPVKLFAPVFVSIIVLYAQAGAFSFVNNIKFNNNHE